MLLVNGRMVLNENGTELLRVEGRLSKNPSFWTNMVDIMRDFARLDGVRVPVSTDTIAKLKFAGTSRMDVSLQLRVDQRPAGQPRSASGGVRGAAPLSKNCSARRKS